MDLKGEEASNFFYLQINSSFEHLKIATEAQNLKTLQQNTLAFL